MISRCLPGRSSSPRSHDSSLGVRKNRPSTRRTPGATRLPFPAFGAGGRRSGGVHRHRGSKRSPRVRGDRRPGPDNLPAPIGRRSATVSTLASFPGLALQLRHFDSAAPPSLVVEHSGPRTSKLGDSRHPEEKSGGSIVHHSSARRNLDLTSLRACPDLAAPTHPGTDSPRAGVDGPTLREHSPSGASWRSPRNPSAPSTTWRSTRSSSLATGGSCSRSTSGGSTARHRPTPGRPARASPPRSSARRCERDWRSVPRPGSFPRRRRPEKPPVRRTSTPGSAA